MGDRRLATKLGAKPDHASSRNYFRTLGTIVYSRRHAYTKAAVYLKQNGAIGKSNSYTFTNSFGAGSQVLTSGAFLSFGGCNYWQGGDVGGHQRDREGDGLHRESDLPLRLTAAPDMRG